MRTNIVIDDNLLKDAFKYSDHITTKKELVEVALKEFVQHRKMKNLQDLRGKIQFADDYNYKNLRMGK